MLPRRIYLNLAAFVVLFAVLSGWAVQNVLRPDLLEDTYDVTAEFTDATGLRTGVEVTLRGIRVGRVSTVQIVPGQAEVVMAIDADADLPMGAGAAIRRRSAVGEPYVAIEIPAGWRSGDGSLPTAGYRIPLGSTSTPLAYGELFTAADSLLAAVEPADLGIVTSELALALGGRGEELAQLSDDASDAITTLAGGQAELRALGDNLTTLTRTIADRSPTIADALDDLGVVVDTVAANTDDLQAILATAPSLADRIDAILAAGYADVRCAADATATIGTALGNDETVARIRELLRAAETASVVIPQAIFQGPDGRYLSGTFGFAPGELNEYDVFQEFEAPPPLASCEATAPPGAEPVASSETAAGASAGGAGTEAARPEASTEITGAPATPSATATTASRSSWLPAAAAAALLLAVAIGTFAGLRDRIRNRGHTRNGGASS